MGGTASEARRGDGAKRKSVRKSCRSAVDSAPSALERAPAAASGSSCELANPAQVRQIASQTGVLLCRMRFVAGWGAVAELQAGAPWRSCCRQGTVGTEDCRQGRCSEEPSGSKQGKSPAASRERAPRAASEQKRERQNPLS